MIGDPKAEQNEFVSVIALLSHALPQYVAMESIGPVRRIERVVEEGTSVPGPLERVVRALDAIVEDFVALVAMTDGVSDPMFPTDSNFRDSEKWESGVSPITFYRVLSGVAGR